MEIKIIHWHNKFDPDEAVLRKELEKEGYSVFKWADSAGTCYPRHHHDYDESIWILEGEVEFEIDGDKFLLRGGDRLCLPSGVTHTTIVSDSQKCFYLIGQKE